jgi:hypothetical protein
MISPLLKELGTDSESDVAVWCAELIDFVYFILGSK